MRKKILIATTSLLAFLTLALFMGCPGQPGPDKTIQVFTITKLDSKATHQLAGRDITGLAASLNGNYVYVARSEGTPRVLDVDAGTWDDATDFENFKWAHDGKKASAKSAEARSIAPSFNGLASSINGVHPFVIESKGKDMNTLYSSIVTGKKRTNGDDIFQTLKTFVVDRDGNQFLYVASQTKKSDLEVANQGKSIKFRPYIAPPAGDAPLGMQL